MFLIHQLTLPSGWLRQQRRNCLALFGAIAVLVTTSPSDAQTVQQPATASQPLSEPAQITMEIIEARRKEAEESKDLDDEAKKKAAEYYRLATEALNRATELMAKEAECKAKIETVQERVEQFKQQTALLGKQPETATTVDTLAELEHELAKQQLRLTELKDALAKAEAEPTTRTNRRTELLAAQLSAPERFAENQKQLDTAVPADEKPLLTLARRTELLARRQMLQCI